jgi:FkbM family methyltransferase
MSVDINRIVSNPFGRFAYQLARPFVNFMRRRAHPDIPTNHTVTTVQCGDRKFTIEHRRRSDDDVLAIKQCFELRQYDMPVGRQGAIVQKFHDEIVASGRQPLIVDCGANIGASVLWLATRYPKAHIVAIEPAPQNFALLQKNTAGLDGDHRLAGIAAEDGQAFLKDRGGEMGFQTISSAEGASVPMLPVKMISIATLLADKSPSRYTPFILKIDIERC